MNEIQFLIQGEFHYIIYLGKWLLGENKSTLDLSLAIVSNWPSAQLGSQYISREHTYEDSTNLQQSFFVFWGWKLYIIEKIYIQTNT